MSTIRIIYLYLVCLITIFMAVGGFVTAVNHISQYFFPTSYSYYNYPVYYEDEDYNDEKFMEYDYKADQANQEIEKQNQKIRDLKASITSLALVAVSIPIFIYHWKKIELERKELGV